MNYKQQYDKLTEAYIKNEVTPWSPCNCFVGNLLNNNCQWVKGRSIPYTNGTMKNNLINGYKNLEIDNYKVINECIKSEAKGYYTSEEIISLESRFMSTYLENLDVDTSSINELLLLINEDALFLAFEAALDLLKYIHISKGENIEEQFTFTKRTLTYATA